MISFLKASALVSALIALAGCSSSSSSGNGVNPGCLGAPGRSCTDRPEGTTCPGGDPVCTSCGAGIYTMAQRDCTCTSGTWQCAPSKPGQVVCTSQVGSYVDPTCSELFEAGTDAGSESDAFASGDAL